MTARRLPLLRFLIRLARDQRGGPTTVELSILAMPFLLMLFAVMQMGAYYMTQTALDAGTVQAAESLRAVFSTGTTPSTPSAASLKSTIVSGSGTGIVSSGLAVEVQPLANLDSGAVAVSDGLTSYGSAWTPLVLRAKYTFATFLPLPGFPSTFSINSSAIVRRQGQ